MKHRFHLGEHDGSEQVRLLNNSWLSVLKAIFGSGELAIGDQ
jgi:hypothetical protein